MPPLFNLHFVMTLASFLFSLISLALIAAANPVVVNRFPVTLPLTRIINSTGVYRGVPLGKATLRPPSSTSRLQITSFLTSHWWALAVQLQLVSRISSCSAYFDKLPRSDSLIIDTGRLVLHSKSNVLMTVFERIVPTPGSAQEKTTYLAALAKLRSIQ